jgi:DNA-binding transcriptional ArsR family regulator
MADQDAVFKALADTTRRSLLDELRDGPATTGELCAAHTEMSRFGVMDHLRVLHEAGLIVVEPVGRTRVHHLNPVPVREVYQRWIRPIAEAPADELLALKRVAEARVQAPDVRDARAKRRAAEPTAKAKPRPRTATGRSA